MTRLSGSEQRFAAAAVRRERLFVVLSVTGVVVGAGLALYYGGRWISDPTYPIGLRLVVVILVLLNARQNLRQARYARALRALMEV